MITFEDSQSRLDSLELEPVGVQKLFLTETLGRVLAEDVVAAENSPERPTAAMDGYAIRFADQSAKKVRVVGVNPAGSLSEKSLKAGEAIKTFTGSLMPEGADTLIPIENVEREGEYIKIVKSVPKGFSVRPIGENYQKGELLISKGSRISFAEIGVLGSLNRVSIKVYQRPKVAILATGSEVLEVGQERKNPSQIRSSNSYTLEALTRLHGGEPVQMGAVKDDKATITQALKEALRSADIVVTTGGVSVGDYDYVKEVVEKELKAELLFKGVRIKPGQHVMIAKRENKILVGLPGFAYSSTVTFLLYVVPLIYKMAGAEYRPNIIDAVLREPFLKKSSKTEFTPCNLTVEGGEYFVDFKGKKDGTSAILTNMLNRSALVVTDPEEGNKEPGERVRVWLIEH